MRRWRRRFWLHSSAQLYLTIESGPDVLAASDDRAPVWPIAAAEAGSLRLVPFSDRIELARPSRGELFATVVAIVKNPQTFRFTF